MRFPLAATLVFALAGAALAQAPAGAPAASSAGRIVITDPEHHRVRVLDPASGAVLATIPTGIGPRGFAVQGRRLAVADRGTERVPGSSVTVIALDRLVAAETLLVCEACAPSALVIDGDTTWGVAQNPPQWLELRGGVTPRSTSIEGPVPLRVFAAGSRWLAAASRGPALLLYDRAERRASALEVGPSAEVVAVRPGTAEVWVALAPEGRLVVVDLAGATPATRAAGPLVAWPQDMAFAADGRILCVSAGRDRSLVLFDTTTLREAGRLRFGSAPHNVAVAPNGHQVAVFLPEEGRAVVVDVSDPHAPRETASLPLDADVIEWQWIAS